MNKKLLIIVPVVLIVAAGVVSVRKLLKDLEDFEISMLTEDDEFEQWEVA